MLKSLHCFNSFMTWNNEIVTLMDPIKQRGLNFLNNDDDYLECDKVQNRHYRT